MEDVEQPGRFGRDSQPIEELRGEVVGVADITSRARPQRAQLITGRSIEFAPSPPFGQGYGAPNLWRVICDSDRTRGHAKLDAGAADIAVEVLGMVDATITISHSDKETAARTW